MSVISNGCIHLGGNIRNIYILLLLSFAIPCNDGEVELWGECYNIEETTELNLSNNGLTGEIPSEIGNLTNLRFILLDRNQLTGEIPSEIGELTNLDWLILFSNDLTGEIPSDIWEMTNLTKLNLFNNQLTGVIPSTIGNLTNLTQLNLGFNQLTGEIPAEIGNLTDLPSLGLNSNQLTGEIPSEIWEMTNLIGIFLSNNNFTGEIGNITTLINLEKLWLNGNQFSGQIPENIGNLTNLQQLWLWNNLFTGNIPSSIGSLINVYNLQFQNNQLNGVIPESICNLTQVDWSPTYVDGATDYLYGNNLCPPYPECVEEDIGYQDTSECSVLGCTHPNATNYDETANVDDGSCEYETVQIGHQVWMTENLKVTHYNNGDAIPTGLNDALWTSTTEGAFSIYDENPDNAEIYGNLYNWHAVQDERGICPIDWHVPSDDEYKELEIYLGMSSEQANLAEAWRGTNQGEKIKDNISWNGTNESGYSALPAGYRTGTPNNNDYYKIEEYSYFWTSTKGDNEGAWDRYVYDNQVEIGRGIAGLNTGWSVRCLETIEGCTDSLAINDTYDPLANTNDGSCEYPDNVDYSLSFDGVDDYVQIEQSEQFAIGNSSHTLMTWVYFYELSDMEYNYLIALGNNATGEQSSLGVTKDGKLFNSSFGSPIVITESTININQWNHLAMSYDNSAGLAEFYLNGILVETENIVLNPTVGKMFINSSTEIGAGLESNKIIDNVSIWNTRLDSTQIQSYMSSATMGAEVGLIANYKFNAGTGNTLYDHSGNGNHGTINGATWVENIYGCTDSYAENYNSDANWDDGSCEYPDNGDYSLSFGGDNDYVDLGNSDNLITGTNVTYSCWFKLTDTDAAYLISNQRSFGSTNLSLGVNRNEATETAGYIQGVIWNGTHFKFVKYDGSVDDNAWHHIAFTTTSSAQVLYLDGSQVATGSNIFPQSASSDKASIGSLNGTGYFTGGNIDEVAVWDTVLTQADIQSYMYTPPTGEETGLVGYWKFNAGEDTTLYDHSGNGNHGTINGATWAGCTDENSCEYLDDAVIDDGSCATYPIDEHHDCEGNCIAEGINLDEDGFDCSGDCGGDAVVDNCSTCDNDPNNDCEQDCNQDWGGSAYLDDCDVCSQGNTDHEPNSDKDLCSVCFGDNSTCCLDDNADNYLEDGGCEYHYTIELHEGANLVSFWALPEDNSLDSMFIDLDGIITGVIGEGTAAQPNELWGWIGSLSEISCTSGYWITVSEDVPLNIAGTELCPCDTVYQIHEGSNLVSWPSSSSCSVGEAIPDEFEPYITGIIGEGVATIPSETFGWSGSLTSLLPTKGYWLGSEIEMYYNWDACSCSGSLARIVETEIKINSEYFNQSTKQAFYFIESIENIEVGDWILSYNGDKVIGARAWTGSIIDVPAMGDDGSDYTKGYLESGVAPSFKILRGDELINLEGDIPSWDNNQLFMVSSLTEVALPETFSLDRAYPNPFNPTTTLSFAIPIDSEVSLSIYNLQGREVSTLINGNMDAGYHSVVWNADSYSSGVYFVKMIAGEFVNTQKLMLVK